MTDIASAAKHLLCGPCAAAANYGDESAHEPSSASLADLRDFLSTVGHIIAICDTEPGIEWICDACGEVTTDTAHVFHPLD